MKNKRVKVSIWITLILVLCLGAVSSANAATLTIVSLECLTPEDREVDEVELRVTVDRSLATKYGIMNMSAGDLWELNRQLTFTDTIKFRLYDLDDPDPDDKLGEYTINATPTNGSRRLTFNWDGAHYKLRFRVDP